MRFILTILFLFLTTNVFASDHYEYCAGSKWKINEYINEEVLIRVDPGIKFRNPQEKIRFVKKTFNQVKRNFFKFHKIDDSHCESGHLEVRVISKQNLNNKIYFAGEYFTGEKVFPQVIGRYFEKTNILYIVQLNEYYWEEYFAHELAHYFYDDCTNINKEHKLIDQFLKIYYNY